MPSTSSWILNDVLTVDLTDSTSREVGKVYIAGFNDVAGQKLMSGSFPVVIASDQSTIPVSLDYDSTSPFPIEIISSIPLQVRNLLHDNFNCNSNLQINDLDVDATNPVFVDIVSSIPLEVIQAIHDDLNANVNLQINDQDVDATNPVFVDIVSSVDLQVIQSTHDNLNCNANLQISDQDVDSTNPVFVDIVSSVDLSVDIVSSVDLSVDIVSSVDLQVIQSTHDNLNCNSNLQISDQDVDSTNPVFVDIVSTVDLPVEIMSSVDLQVIQDTHDDLNANVNLQINDTDVDSTNPVPVDIVSSVDLQVIQATHDNLNCNANLQVNFENVDNTNAVPVTLVTVLSSEVDSIDVAKMSKGEVDSALEDIVVTTTSSEIDCRGFNAISIEMEVIDSTNGWTVNILGSAISGGTFGYCYTPKDDGTFTQQVTSELYGDINATFYFTGVPNYVKVEGEGNDGTLTVRVTPMNL